MRKNVTKQTQHVHCNISDNAPLRGDHMHDLDLTVNMLGLCDPSNLLFVLSTEERRTLLKFLKRRRPKSGAVVTSTAPANQQPSAAAEGSASRLPCCTQRLTPSGAKTSVETNAQLSNLLPIY